MPLTSAYRPVPLASAVQSVAVTMMLLASSLVVWCRPGCPHHPTRASWRQGWCSRRDGAAVANLWKGLAAKVGRLAGRESAPVRTRTPAPTPAQVARRRQVVALQRRRLVYAPDLDGQADPGEIVWTWVAYEDDPRQGKD